MNDISLLNSFTRDSKPTSKVYNKYNFLMKKMGEIIIVGSANTDMVVKADKLLLR